MGVLPYQRRPVQPRRYSRNVLHRRSSLDARWAVVFESDSRWYRGERARAVYVSRCLERANQPWRRHDRSARAFYRDVLDCAVGLHDLHAGY